MASGEHRAHCSIPGAAAGGLGTRESQRDLCLGYSSFTLAVTLVKFLNLPEPLCSRSKHSLSSPHKTDLRGT